MMSTVALPRASSRLLQAVPADVNSTFAAHVARFGDLDMSTGGDFAKWLLNEVELAGLTGRGGAGFPSVRKLELAASGESRPTLVINCMEGDPASSKDAVLVSHSPHLVLDGIELAAVAIKATEAVVCLSDHRNGPTRALAAALTERVAAAPFQVPIVVRQLRGRYLAGEESALVDAISGGRGVPSYRPDKSIQLTVGRRAAVVHNVETLAHVALIARYGAEWFRSVGAPDAPGTCLVSVGGAVRHPGVVEVATGTPVREILELAHPFGGVAAVLVGGYGGVWVPSADADTGYAPTALGAIGARMGVGALVALGAASCGLRETAGIVQYMARESAGQCGPCLFGLPAIAADLDQIAGGDAPRNVLDRLLNRCSSIEGRGACGHPDTIARLVRSAVEVFSADLEAHLRGVSCAASHRPPVFAFPRGPLAR
jgi:NADH:ubiquinone oxidoreductase subunit F (NADH-binding)